MGKGKKINKIKPNSLNDVSYHLVATKQQYFGPAQTQNE
jgi:hypothetical protein